MEEGERSEDTVSGGTLTPPTETWIIRSAFIVDVIFK